MSGHFSQLDVEGQSPAHPLDSMVTHGARMPRWSDAKFLRRVVIGLGALCGILLVVVIVVASTSGSDGSNGGGSAATGGLSPTNPNNPAGGYDMTTLPGSMKTASMMKSLQDLQDVAMAHAGSRSISLGMNASVDYVIQRLNTEAPRFKHHIETFPVETAKVVGKLQLSMVEPEATEYVEGVDFSIREGNGAVNSNLVYLPDGGCDTSALKVGEIAFFAGEDRACGGVATQRDLVRAAGAGALLYYYDGQPLPNYGDPQPGHSIPIFFLSSELGNTLKGLAESGTAIKFSLKSQLKYTTLPVRNLIVDTDLGDENNVFVIGCHIDSVDAGPGINDDGSGTATVLETLLQYHRLYSAVGISPFKPINRVRFAFFGAEEEGLLGSFAYVKSLTKNNNVTHALDKVVGMIDVDMLGSPNYVRFVYNASSGDAPKETWKGNKFIEKLFTAWWDERKLEYDFVPFDGRSDYQGFVVAGVPACGITTGAEKMKTVRQRTIYGGVANAAYDPCYHLACDTVENINQEALLQMAQAIARATSELARLPNARAMLGRPRQGW